MADKRSHATDPATLRAIPASNATRVGSPGTRRQRTSQKFAPVKVMRIDDEGDEVTVGYLVKTRQHKTPRRVIDPNINAAHLQSIRKMRRI